MNSTNIPALPHPVSFDGIFFVTLRLRDALPDSFGQNLALQFYSKQTQFAQNPNRSALLSATRKQLFSRFDQALDLEKYGDSCLRHPSLAQVVADGIQHHNGMAYDLLGYSILPNHVHLLLDLRSPCLETTRLCQLESFDFEPLREAVRKIQNATEPVLKKGLQQMGEHVDSTVFQKHNPAGIIQSEGKFWHGRTFDFHIRDAGEFEKTIRFILQNPVTAALTEHWQSWPFSFWKK